MTVYAVAYRDDRMEHVVPSLVFVSEEVAEEARKKREVLTRLTNGVYFVMPINVQD